LHAIWHQRLSLRCLAKTVVVECVSDYAGVCVCCFADSAWTFQAKTRRHTSWVEQACFQTLPSLTTWPPSNLFFFRLSLLVCVCLVCVCCCADSAWTVQAKKRRQLSRVSGASLLPQVTFTDFKRTLLFVWIRPLVLLVSTYKLVCVFACVCL
jgi:hypothetical protein